MTAVACQSTDLDSALRRVAHAMASDDARPILASVLIEGDENGLRVVAADNYRVAVADVAEGDYSALGRRVVPRDELPILRAFLNVWKKAREVTLAHASDGRLVASDEYRSVTLRLIDGQYPNYRAVTDARPNDRESIGINPAYLFEASKSLPKGQPAAVRLPSSREKIAAAATVTAKGYLEVIMPIRLEGQEPTGAETLA